MHPIRHVALVVVVTGILALRAGGASADGTPGVIGPTDLQNQPDWTGFYVGGKVGGVWGDIDWSQNVNVFTAAGAAPPGASVNFSPSGVGGGVIAGGNLQTGRWIFGAELSYSGVELSQTATSPHFPATDTFSTQIDWLLTVEGRIGLSVDNYLLFGKGGWVGTDATLSLVSTRGAGPTATSEEFVDGWTIGGGIELLCWRSLVLGVEYDYIDLNLSNAASCPFCDAGIVLATPPTITGNATISSVMARASYLFRPED